MRNVKTGETESGVLRLLEEEFAEDLLAVMLTGSHGTADQASSSDIDFLVIIASPKRQRRNFVFQGKEIELFINPAPQIEQYLEEDRVSGRGNMQRMLVTGAPLYDPQGVLAKLREIAIAQWDQGPPEIPLEKLWRARYAPADTLRDIADVIDREPAAAAFLFGITVAELMDTHYRLARRWRPKPKRLLADVEVWDAEAARLLRSAAEGPTDARYRALQALARHVLAPIGGLMPLEWRSEWEPLTFDRPRHS